MTPTVIPQLGKAFLQAGLYRRRRPATTARQYPVQP